MTPGTHGGLRVVRKAAEPLTVVLVRHGQTPLTVEQRYSGAEAPGPELTDHGRTQAAQAADLCARIGREVWPELSPAGDLVTSPLRRTAQTAAAIGRRLGLTPRTEPALTECDFGAWEGLTIEEIDRGWPGALDEWQRDGTVPAPGGESVTHVGQRVATALDRLLATSGARTVVAVCHAVTIRAAVGLALSTPPGAWVRMRLAPASLSVIRLRPGGRDEVLALSVPPAR